MFSESLKKMDKMPYKTMLLIAAGLVILCQLVAMALVVDGQVKRAEARYSALDSQRIALALCNEAGSVAARQSCIQQAMAASSLPGEPEAVNQVQSIANSGTIERGDVPAVSGQGFMPVSYTVR